MKPLLTYLLFLSLAFSLSAQDTLTFFYRKNGKETSKINKAAYCEELINYGNHFLYRKNHLKSKTVIQESELQSWEPFIENGLSSYFDKKSKRLIAKGYYKNGELSGKWIYKTKNEYDTVYYSSDDEHKVENQNSEPQQTYMIVQQMPYIFPDEKTQKKKEVLEKRIKKLIDSGKLQSELEKYSELQQQIAEINNQPFEKYINNHMHYPVRAKLNKIQGRVFTRCVVDENGEIVDAIVTKGIDRDLDNEALRLIRNMPAWNAGMHNGKAVRVAVILEIIFEL